MDKVKQNYDGLYYVVVAKSWYDKDFIRNNFSFPIPLEYYSAHLPTYPALIWLAAKIGSISFVDAMLLVSLLSSMITSMVVVVVFAKYGFTNPTWAGILWLFWWPRIWAVRSVGSPEAIFIGFVISALYFFDKGRYWLASLLACGAVATKSPGILLFFAFALMRRKKSWPILLIPCALVAVFGVYWLRTGDFWAYFRSGDNIHLQSQPFGVFDTKASWVGTWWLEDVLWVYVISVFGVYETWKKNRVWGTFGAVFLTSIMFVSHRDISRYALPVVPVVIFGLSEFLNSKQAKVILGLLIIPVFFYTVNFVSNNFAEIANWFPLL
jgi:Gpi18-like mannosyltransferase